MESAMGPLKYSGYAGKGPYGRLGAPAALVHVQRKSPNLPVEPAVEKRTVALQRQPDGILQCKLAGITVAGGTFVAFAGRGGGEQRPENRKAVPVPKRFARPARGHETKGVATRTAATHGPDGSGRMPCNAVPRLRASFPVPARDRNQAGMPQATPLNAISATALHRCAAPINRSRP